MNWIARVSSLTAVLAGAALVSLPATEAGAVSLNVRRACAMDYLSHCSMHAVGSPGVRQCMSNVGPRLSKSCVAALVSSGEVSKTEVARRAASLR